MIHHHRLRKRVLEGQQTVFQVPRQQVHTTIPGDLRINLSICINFLSGDSVKVEVVIDQLTISFTSHDDFLFCVNDSSQYQVGDIVLFDGNKLDDDMLITAKILQSIVGKSDSDH